MGELSCRVENQGKADEHDYRANEGGDVGIDILDADLGEDRGKRGEHGREHGPELPGRQGFRVHGAQLIPGLIATSEATKQSSYYRRRARRLDRFALLAMTVKTASIPVVRQHWQRRDFDAFVDQAAGLLRRGLAVDRAMFDVAVMHLAGFGGKALADIVGVLDDMIAQLLELGAQLAL